MKLLNDEVKTLLDKYPYNSQDSKGKDAVILARFFTPWSHWEWYVLEYDKIVSEDNGMPYDILYGIVIGDETEYGSFSVSELESVTGPVGLRIERDEYFGNGRTLVGEIPELRKKFFSEETE